MQKGTPEFGQFGLMSLDHIIHRKKAGEHLQQHLRENENPYLDKLFTDLYVKEKLLQYEKLTDMRLQKEQDKKLQQDRVQERVQEDLEFMESEFANKEE